MTEAEAKREHKEVCNKRAELLGKCYKEGLSKEEGRELYRLTMRIPELLRIFVPPLEEVFSIEPEPDGKLKAECHRCKGRYWKRDMTREPCPYAQDVNHDDTPQWHCAACLRGCADDI